MIIREDLTPEQKTIAKRAYKWLMRRLVKDGYNRTTQHLEMVYYETENNLPRVTFVSVYTDYGLWDGRMWDVAVYSHSYRAVRN